MATPDTHPVVLQPPYPGIHQDTGEMYKFLYEIWKRTGTYKSSLPNLQGLTASAKELNTLVGIRTDDSVQEQLNQKANSASLGTMSTQNANSVTITGGTISGTTFTSGTITNSSITLKAGDGGETVKPGGTIDINTTPVGNITTGEDTLITYTMPANTLNANAQFIEIQTWGIVAAKANNKTIKLKLGSTTLLTTGAVAANAGSWFINAIIVRTGSATQQCIAKITSSNTLILDSATYTDVTENLITNLAIFCTGEATATDDIVQKGAIIKWFNN